MPIGLDVSDVICYCQYGLRINRGTAQMEEIMLRCVVIGSVGATVGFGVMLLTMWVGNISGMPWSIGLMASGYSAAYLAGR